MNSITKWGISAFLAAVLAAFSGGNVFAESKDLTELSLEDLMDVRVVGASRFEQSITDAPSSVTVITAAEIKKYGYRNLAEIINSVRGFQVTNDRSYSYIGVRGFGRTGDYNTRILVLVDGHRINENIYDSVYVGFEGIIDIDLIDRVEFIRGPGSSLYGNNAFFGVVNIITRSAESIKSGEISASGGSLETVTGRATFGIGEERKSVLLSASVFNTDGERSLYFPEYDSPATNNGVAYDVDGEDSYQLFGTIALKKLTLQTAYSGRTKQLPTGSYGSDFNDPRAKTSDYRSYVDLKYEQMVEDGDQWGIMARLFYDHYHYNALMPWGVLNRDYARNDWIGGELQLSRKMFANHFLLAGAELQENLKQRFEAHDVDPYLQYIDTNHTTGKKAFYLQDEYRLTEKVRVNAGVRYDHFETFESATSPRAAVIYQPLENTAIKFIYGEAFRAPNNYEIFYDVDAYAMEGNPALKPEKIRSYEAVLEQQVGENMKVTLTGFRSTVKNIISQIEDAGADAAFGTGDEFWIFRNGSGAVSMGAEAELEGEWESGYKGRLSYTYQEARDRDTDVILVNSPRQAAKGNIIVPLLAKRLFAGTEAQFYGGRRTSYGNETAGFFVVNATLFSEGIIDGVDISASVYNLFDRDYGYPGGDEHLQELIRQNGRTYRMKVTWHF